jgi:hypothetical protein
MSEDYKMMQVGTGPNDMQGSQVDQTHAAARVSVRPLEHQGLVGGIQGGHFRASFSYSNTAAKPTAASPIFSLQNTDPVKLVLIKRVRAYIACTTAYTAAGAQDVALYHATGFTGADSGGTALAASTGAQQRLRVGNMASTILGTTLKGQISSGDTLTAGTRAVDSYPLGYAAWVNPAAAGAVAGPFDLFDADRLDDHPLVVALNEGIVITTPIGNGQAAGVSKWAITVDWAEVASY